MKDEILYFYDHNTAEEITKAGKESRYIIEKADMSVCKISVRYNHKGEFTGIDII